VAHDVFVCHPTEQKHVADAIVARMEGAGIRCWIAPRDITPGADFLASIVAAIEASKVLVVVFSSDANASPHVMREVKQAVEAGIPVLPFRVEAVEPSPQLGYLIGPSHWLDALTAPLDEHISHLASVAREVLDDPSRAAVDRSADAPVRRRRRWRWVAVAALVAATIGIVALTAEDETPQPDLLDAVITDVADPGLELPGRQLMVGAHQEQGSPVVIAVGADFSEDPDGDAATWISTDEGDTWELVDHGMNGLPGLQVFTGVTRGPSGTIAVGYEQDDTGRGSVVWRRGLDSDGPRWEVIWDGKTTGGPMTVMLDVTEGPYGLTAVGWDEDLGSAAWHSVDGTEWERAEGYLPGGTEAWLNGLAQVALEAELGTESALLAVGSNLQSVWRSVDGGLTWERESLDRPDDAEGRFIDLVPLPATNYGGREAVLLIGVADEDQPMLWTISNWMARYDDPEVWRGVWNAIPVATDVRSAVLSEDPLSFLAGGHSEGGPDNGTLVRAVTSTLDGDGNGRLLLFGERPGDDGSSDAAVWIVTFDEILFGG
jgi:hypothetical protein